MKTIELVCAGCQTTFTKIRKEYDRQIRKGKQDFYCTRQCFGKYVSPKNLETERAISWRTSHRNAMNLRHNVKKQQENANPFCTYMKFVKQRRNQVFDIDIDYLKLLWDGQGGRCAYTGILMGHPHWAYATNAFSTASLDRIDSSKGYVRGNVQFALRALNLAKGAANDNEFRSFLTEIKVALDRQEVSS